MDPAARGPAREELRGGGARQGHEAHLRGEVTVAPTASPARVALIPGGAKGIGRRIASDLAARGWPVAIAYRTSRDAAEEAVRQIAAAGGKGLAVAADVSVPAECERLMKAVTQWQGRVDA